MMPHGQQAPPQQAAPQAQQAARRFNPPRRAGAQQGPPDIAESLLSRPINAPQPQSLTARLPEELLSHVAQHLPARDVLRMGRVDRTAHQDLRAGKDSPVAEATYNQGVAAQARRYGDMLEDAAAARGPNAAQQHLANQLAANRPPPLRRIRSS